MPDELIRFKTALQAGLLPEDLTNWLLSAIHRFEAGDCKTLCRALGLRAPGMSSIETRRKIAERDALIKTIAQGYPGTPWEKAIALFERIKRYPRVGDEKPLYSALFAIGARIPGDITSIYKILLKP